MYSFSPIRSSSSSTLVGQLVGSRFRLSSFPVLYGFTGWSGSTSTLMNLKCPNRPLAYPRHTPDAFIDRTSMISPFCLGERKIPTQKRFHKFPAQSRNQSTTEYRTLNLKASLSYGFGLLSIRAIARQIGTIVVRSSAESELCGLPGRTRACVPKRRREDAEKIVLHTLCYTPSSSPRRPK